MLFNKAKISDYKIKKIIKHFCYYITADKTAGLMSMNRNTINHWYLIFRRAIHIWQHKEFEKIIGQAEVDESYFGAKRIVESKDVVINKRERGTWKQSVFGIFKRNGRVYTEIITNCRKKVL